jgi:hypothetical protein
MNVEELRGKLKSTLISLEDPYDYNLTRDSIKHISDALKLIPEFSVFDDKYRIVGNGAGMINTWGVAYDLIKRASETSVDSSIDELLEHAVSDTMTIRKAIIMDGIKLPDIINLSDNIKAGPISSENRHQRQFIVNVDVEVKAKNESTIIWEDIEYPSIYSERINEKPKNINWPDMWDFSNLETASLFFSMLGPNKLTLVGTSIAGAHWIPSFGPLGRELKYVLPIASKEISLVNTDKICKAYQQYLLCEPSLSKRLKLALKRISIADKKGEYVDKAIDLGIASEVIFTDIKSSNESISLMLRLRAAHFLGSDYDERNEIYNLLKKFYDVRSKAVHTGEVLKPKNFPEVIELTRDNLVRAIFKLLSDGEPSWQEIILGKNR